MDDSPYPKCFDSQTQFDKWKENARTTGLFRESYCTDCNPKHKLQMVRHKRCAHPTVQFEIDEEGNTVGYLPAAKKFAINVSDGAIHKWLKPDEQPSIRYLGVSSQWHPMPGTFDRIPTPKKERR